MEITNNLGLKCPEQNETFDVEHMNDNMKILDEIWKVIYPVGSVYISVNAVSPQDLFGGTWVQIEDRFLLSAGSSYTAGATGGAATHTLTTAQMPSHTHTFTGTAASHTHASGLYKRIDDYGSGTLDAAIWSSSYGDSVKTGSTSITPKGTNSSTGGGGAHNNMPPYLVVYMWKRTA